MCKDAIKSGLVYLTGHVDGSGDVHLVDVGRDTVHAEPIILCSWDESTKREDASFVETVFPPEYLANEFAPEENVRVAYDHGFDFTPTVHRGEWSGVDIYDVAVDERRRLRENNTDGYSPDEALRDLLYGLLDG
jgi:hypothetical protein